MPTVTGTVVDAAANGNVRVQTSDGIVDVGSDANTTVSINGSYDKAGPRLRNNSPRLVAR